MTCQLSTLLKNENGFTFHHLNKNGKKIALSLWF